MENVLQIIQTNRSVAAEEAKANVTRDPLPVIQADPSQMSQVLQNLIANASSLLKRRTSGCPYLC